MWQLANVLCVSARSKDVATSQCFVCPARSKDVAISQCFVCPRQE